MLPDEISGEQVQNSDESIGDRKRKRKALSCFDCRRRKLKCDREAPCGRCRKAGHPETCVYNPETSATTDIVHENRDIPAQQLRRKHSDSWQLRDEAETHLLWVENGTQSMESVVSKVYSQSERIAQLESRVALLENLARQPLRQERTHAVNSPEALAIREKEQRNEPETMLVKGKAFRTIFYGASNATSILAHVIILKFCYMIFLTLLVSPTQVIRTRSYYA